MAATIKDVAKKAGVSISTVSRVVNDSKPVSPEVKKKVVKAIEELGYKPNEIARTLVTKKSYIIGVIVTDLGNSYIAEIVRGIEEVGKIYGYDILLCSTFGDKEAELRYLQILNTKQVEGIILISKEVNEKISDFINKTRPFLYLNRYYLDNRYSTVSIDNERAAYEMTSYILKQGYKKVVYISNTENEKSIDYYKIQGYQSAVKESGNEKKVYISDGMDIKSGYQIAEKILKGKPDVIFCGYDEIAIGVLNYCYDNNIRVPEDVSVAGFGDIRVASVYRPSLSTIKVPYYDIGAVSIRKIIKGLSEDISSKNEEIILPYQIIKRKSLLIKKI